MRLPFVLLSSLLSVLAACNEPCPPEPERPPVESYDLACDVDSDCVLVSIPNCSPCGCAETPLRAVDAGRFVDDQTICCGEPEDGVNCDRCRTGFAACDEGTCIFASCEGGPFAADARCERE